MIKVCNIISPDGYEDSTLTKLSKNTFVFSCNDQKNLISGIPTLWYGYKFAVDKFGRAKIDMMKEGKFDDQQYWCYNDQEIASDYAESFVFDCVTRFLNHIDDGIDPVFEDFDMDSFISGLGEYPLIHNGKYELYFGEYTNSGDILISSMKKDALKYINIDPVELFYTIIDELEGRCMVVSTDEFDLFEVDYEPVFIVDYIQSKIGSPITPERLIKSFYPRYITKGELLTYYMKLARHHSIIPFLQEYKQQDW